MTDILDDLRGLQKQATTERSHYYVAACCARAIGEIIHLRQQAAYGSQSGHGGVTVLAADAIKCGQDAIAYYTDQQGWDADYARTHAEVVFLSSTPSP